MLSWILSALKSAALSLYHLVVHSFRGYVAMLLFFALGSPLAWLLFALVPNPGFILCYIVVTTAMCVALWIDDEVMKPFCQWMHEFLPMPSLPTSAKAAA